jgi:hypothetical protein
LFVFGADIDDFGVCVPGDLGGSRVIVRAFAFCNLATGRCVAAGTTNAEALLAEPSTPSRRAL